MSRKAAFPLVACSLVSLASVAWAAEPRAGAAPLGQRLAAQGEAGMATAHEDGSQSFFGAVALPAVAGGNLTSEVADVVPAVRAYFVAAMGNPRDLELTSLASDTSPQGTLTHLQQTVNGVPVEGAYALASTRGGVLRYARHKLVQPPAVSTTPRLPASFAEASAVAALQAKAYKTNVSGTEATQLVIMYVGESPRLAWKVRVDTVAPYDSWAVFVDAQDGKVLQQSSKRVDDVVGRTRMVAEPRCTGDAPTAVNVANILWDGTNYSDDTGSFTSTTATQAQVSMRSRYFTLQNQAGQLQAPASIALSPAPALNDALQPAPLDQVDPLYYATQVRAWTRGHAGVGSQSTWTDAPLTIKININDTCNAFYDGTLNFFAAGGQCLNTGRADDVVHHEFGHGIHDHSTPNGNGFDGQVSEGIADFVAATMSNDPGMAGLFTCATPFRSTDNVQTYCRSGCKLNANSEVHDAGLAISGALWVMRNELVKRYGYDLGVDITDRLFLRFLGVVGPMSSTYQAALASDLDTDTNPANGTVNSCQINHAFKDLRPGALARFPDSALIAPSPSAVIVHTSPGVVDASAPLKIQASVVVDTDCTPNGNANDVVVHYFTQSDPNERTVAMASVGAGTTAGSTKYEATLPVNAGVTVTYYITATVAGAAFIYPPQDPLLPTNDGKAPYHRQQLRYDLAGTSLYTADFETGNGNSVAAAANGNGTAWAWAPARSMSMYALDAASGTKVWSTHLQGLNQFQKGRVSTLALPPLDASGMQTLHLHFNQVLLSNPNARVEVNGKAVWTSPSAVGAVAWRDPVWTFQDVDLAAYAGQRDLKIAFVSDEAVDPQYRVAGWDLDDVQVTASAAAPRDGSAPTDAVQTNYNFDHTYNGGCAACSATDRSGRSFDLVILAALILGGRRALRRR